MRTSKIKRIIFLSIFLLLITSLLFQNQNITNVIADESIDATDDYSKYQVDLDKAIKIKIPQITEDLSPHRFKTSDGLNGWIARIPGSRPIATPAIAGNQLFVGGGYGSYEFYSFDIDSGKLVWQIKSSDDGPTAAVVEDGLVAFNTESCTIVVVDASTGSLVWEEWLGDPLMSQPAIWNGMLYIAYPAGQRSYGQQQQLYYNDDELSPDLNNQLNTPGEPSFNLPAPVEGEDIDPSGYDYRYTHKLLCADLKTGKHIWNIPITGDIISAPIISDKKVFFSCFDGTSFSVDASTGKILWKQYNQSASAPTIVDDQVIYSQKEERDGVAHEGLRRYNAAKGEVMDNAQIASGKADYLTKDSGGGVNLSKESQSDLDSAVGFSTGPESAQLGTANDHLGVSTVVGGWAYQGSRAVYGNERMMNAQGIFLNNTDKDGTMQWQIVFNGKHISDNMQLFSPPALGEKNIYLCSARGHIIAVDQITGELVFAYDTGLPIVFQPALYKGNLYFGTANGDVVCLKTGNPDVDDWTMWGGNAQHNKVMKSKDNIE